MWWMGGLDKCYMDRLVNCWTGWVVTLCNNETYNWTSEGCSEIWRGLVGGGSIFGSMGCMVGGLYVPVNCKCRWAAYMAGGWAVTRDAYSCCVEASEETGPYRGGAINTLQTARSEASTHCRPLSQRCQHTADCSVWGVNTLQTAQSEVSTHYRLLSLRRQHTAYRSVWGVNTLQTAQSEVSTHCRPLSLMRQHTACRSVRGVNTRQTAQSEVSTHYMPLSLRRQHTAYSSVWGVNTPQTAQS